METIIRVETGCIGTCTALPDFDIGEQTDQTLARNRLRFGWHAQNSALR
jgi:hypothetical protein